jgi:hypothetical protein
MTPNAIHPTADESAQYALSAYQGIELGMGKADPLAAAAAKLAQRYPDHLVLLQAGRFLHAFDKSAHVLATLKRYRLQLIGTSDDPHLRAGFPAANFKRRLWSMVQEFGIPYVVALGSQADNYTVYVSDMGGIRSTVLASVTPEIVQQVIADLRQRGELNKAAAKKLLATPDTASFQLKTQAQALDTLLLQDIIKMPRDLRCTYGENVRTCMARLMVGVFGYGQDTQKADTLHRISTEIDLLKHYLTQAPRLSTFKGSFEHRAGLAVELGRLTGGLIRAAGRSAS